MGTNSVAANVGQSEGNYAFAANSGEAKGTYSTALGAGTIATTGASFVIGKYNVEDTEDKYVNIVGNGSMKFDPTARPPVSYNYSNAHTLDWEGNSWFAGTIKVGGTSQDDEAAKEVALKSDVEALSEAKVDKNDTPHQQLVTDADGVTKWEDREFYTSTPYTKIIDDVTLTTAYLSYRKTYVAKIPNMSSIAYKFDTTRVYDIVFNGEEYNCRCYNSTSMPQLLCIGNCSTYTGSENDIGDGEPFGIIVTWGELHTDEAMECTISVSGVITVYKTLPGVYTHVYLADNGGLILGGENVSSALNSIGENSVLFGSEPGGMASGNNSFVFGSGGAMGSNTVAFQAGIARGDYSIATGVMTEANGNYQTAIGKCNARDDDSKYILIAGNGSYMERSNAYTLDWDGNGWFAGTIKVGGTGQDDENAVDVALKSDVEALSEEINSSATQFDKNCILFINMSELDPGFISTKITTADVHDIMSDEGRYSRFKVVQRVEALMGEVFTYFCTKYSANIYTDQSTGENLREKYTFYFGDEAPPIIVDCVNDTITIDPDWVAPET